MAKLITLFKLLPKAHQLALTFLAVFSLIILMLPSEDAQASRQTGKINAPTSLSESNAQFQVPLSQRRPTPPSQASQQNSVSDQTDSTLSAANNTHPTVSEIAQQPLINQTVEPVVSNHKTKFYQVVKGDTLGGLFKRAGLTPKDVYDITQLPLAKKNLLKIMPGEEIEITKTHDDQFIELSYQMDKISTLTIQKSDGKYQENITKKQLEVRHAFTQANISSNFWNAAASAGLSANHIMQLANIFGWDVDFALDIRKGDRFALIFEQQYADGQFMRDGNILAAEFYNQGDRYTAIRYTDGEYYSESGRSMRKAFLRSPVDFKYVSSNFNPKRLHPVTGQVRAHRGVDYVAAVGTPIKAAGNGRVIKSSYNQYNGNYVFIKHNDTYTTKYLHLNKRNVKQGQSVKQGQIIGTLGRTGRVTGAHLHYEFIVNGVHRNPRTVKLPKSQAIASAEKANFTLLSTQLMAQLQTQQQQQLAAQPSDTDDDVSEL
ncbi:peptidoglycan DD-metalloendopeptidase family protein [Shewanella intestini]|uniref:Peptidoglycan DD-metalloendopeptidase family protein n=1 Tax=Shewanella intestini TaxID=2017544 RepID=A0ABS5HYC4_9GAMM|nr:MULTISPECIES: peptidoglycan DD-metalloendopeptidase family protein [Shewanella]MBR9726621.1 peptidoglycan DD-metalloendopeptidase family protein [Shewanella intestini]MRG34813.1 peptidoglycan DD-metalloendopeptidase family protein [Shewanella sp. XMDDZSB0408]